MAADWGEAMSDVELEPVGLDVTPPAAYGHGVLEMLPASAMGKRGREQFAPASGSADEAMHERIKRLNLGRPAAQPQMVWFGSTELSQLTSVEPNATRARHAVARTPSFDAQSERELLDNTYTCMNQLLGKLHEERLGRRRRRPSHIIGMEDTESGDEDL